MVDIFQDISSLENLFCAWHAFRRGKRNKIAVQQFERHLEDGIHQLHQALRSGIWKPSPLRRFIIADPKRRIIHQAPVHDRLVHQAVVQVVAPLLEQSFIFDSYSCRRGKGTHRGVTRLARFARQVSRNYSHPGWALKLDIASFFNTVDHEILLGLLEKKVSCQRTRRLVEGIVDSFQSHPSAGGGGTTCKENRLTTW